MLPDLSSHFPKYTEFKPAAPVYCVTPKTGGCFHRFFDTSPFSPSGRYIALTSMPFEDRVPLPGDEAQVVLVDLETGEERVVATSRGWDTQLGAQVQWGATDHELFYNDMDVATWTPYGVVMDPETGDTRRLGGTVYMASPDGKHVASPCLRRTAVTQAGYGVLVPADRSPQNPPRATDDGVYVTDTASGECKLLVSIAQIVEAVPEAFDPFHFADGTLWGFHVKWNPQGDRLQFVLRFIPDSPDVPRLNSLITFRADGSDIHVPVPGLLWAQGGHHPNWCPDGEHVMMNLKLDSRDMRFVQLRYDGGDLHALTTSLLGSGHPTLHPSGRYIATDAYTHESLAFGDGTTPIRLIDLEADHDTFLVRIRTDPAYRGPQGELRVDPHPAWDATFTRLAFNACPDGTRRVFVADLADML